MLVVPSLLFRDILLDLSCIILDSVLGWFDLEVDISDGIENWEELDLQGTVSVFLFEEESVLEGGNLLDDGLDIAILDNGQISWDSLEVVWATVNGFGSFNCQSITINFSKFNEFLRVVFHVLVDVGEDIIKSVLSIEAIFGGSLSNCNELIKSLHKLASEIVGKIDITHVFFDILWSIISLKNVFGNSQTLLES